jgi:hypothetical protein
MLVHLQKNSSMKFHKTLFLLSFLVLSVSCVSTKSTLKNVDNTAPIPKLTPDNRFVLTQIASDLRYGFDKDYPINVFYRNSNDEELNCKRYLNSLSGPNGEVITFTKTGICCPFPSKNINTGGGFLAVYSISYEGLKTPLVLYLNIYERGLLLAPMGFSIKKS